MLSSQEGASLLQALFTKVTAELNLPTAEFSVQESATALTDSNYTDKLYVKIWDAADDDNGDEPSEENWKLVYASGFEMFKATFDN